MFAVTDDGRLVRRNGWSRPWNAQQVAAWVVQAVFGLLYFSIAAPQVAGAAGTTLLAVAAALFTAHVGLHLLCMTLDPKDPNVTYGSAPRTASELQQSKRKHVIEECECFLCNVRVGARSKHCGVCNKCVSDFDHHCRWMNSCVGGRTYRIFFASVTAGFAGVTLMLAITLYVFAQSFDDLGELNTEGGLEQDFEVWGTTLSPASLRVVLALLALLAAVATLLLGHLFFFHLYLMHRRLSTYDYIKYRRAKAAGQLPDVEKGQEKLPLSEAIFRSNKIAPMPEGNRGAAQELSLAADGRPAEASAAGEGVGDALVGMCQEDPLNQSELPVPEEQGPERAGAGRRGSAGDERRISVRAVRLPPLAPVSASQA